MRALDRVSRSWPSFRSRDKLVRTGAIGAVVAVDGLSGVTVVGVCLQVALGDLEVLARDNLVEGVCTTTEELAGIAVANITNVSFSISFDSERPFDGTRKGRLTTGCGRLQEARHSIQSGRSGTFRCTFRQTY